MVIKQCFIIVLLICQLGHILSRLADHDLSEVEFQQKNIQANSLKCMSHNSSLNSSFEEIKCAKTFDLILCWDETPANQWAEQPCPYWFIGFNPKQKAKRFCQPDGTWMTRRNTTYTDYTQCIVEDVEAKILAKHLVRLKLIAKIGSLISIGSLIIGMILLLSFKRLRCARNILHCNLFGTFFLFSLIYYIRETFLVNSIGFPKDLIIGSNQQILSFNPNVSHWECKTLTAFYRYAESSNHVMIFSEGLYLNTLVSVATFSETNHFKLYITLGWIGPFVWMIPFVVLMLLYGDANSCWTQETAFSYLYVVPQVLIIFLNFVLFINIVRILKNKLNKNCLTESKHDRFKKLAKSTLILLPLFSIFYIAFSLWQPFVKGELPLELELLRLYFEIICSSFQGLLISIIYGFFNSEVRNEVINQIERKLIQRYPNMRRFSTRINRERNSCVSLGNDRFKSSTRISERKIKKLAKAHSIKNDFVNDDNRLEMDLNNNLDSKNRKKVSLNLEQSDKGFNMFKKRKKESNSTITSSLLSSKGSKGTIRLDSIETNHPENLENFSRSNSGLKNKNQDLNEINKMCYPELNEKDVNSSHDEEQEKLLENKNVQNV